MGERGWREAVDGYFGEVTSKWFGGRSLGRDRDVEASGIRRVTAYLRAADGSWDRGELVLRTPAAYQLVWQPFPQGPARVYAGPFAVVHVSAVSAGSVREVELVAGECRARMRLAAADVELLHAALR